jgi:PRA1 family protein
MFRRDHLRSITVLFGIGEERPFYIEKNMSLLVERIRHNITFFYLNYLVLTAILFCLTLITSWTAVFGIGLLAAAWAVVIRATQSGSLTVGGVSIPQKTVTVAMAAVSVFVLMYVLSNVFWWTLFSSGFLVAAHSLTRDASMHKDMNDAVDMHGDLDLAAAGGEDAAFLANGDTV